MIKHKYPAPFKLEKYKNSINLVSKKESLRNKTSQFFSKLFKPKPKDEMEEIYKGEYKRVFTEERKAYLKKKAEQDAKKAAKRDNTLIGIIKEIFYRQ